jgi:hypothetical protein
MMDGKNALNIDDDEKILKVDAILIKGNGKRVHLDKNQIQWRLINNDSDYIKLTTKDNNSFAILSTTKTVVPDDNYVILEASVNYDTGNNFSPNLKAYLPIPFRNSQCIGMSG